MLTRHDISTHKTEWNIPGKIRQATLGRCEHRPPYHTHRLAWYDTSSVQVELSSAAPTDFAFYFLDWDRQSRVEDVMIIDKQSGVTLLQKRIENFGDGVYHRFRLERHRGRSFEPRRGSERYSHRCLCRGSRLNFGANPFARSRPRTFCPGDSDQRRSGHQNRGSEEHRSA